MQLNNKYDSMIVNFHNFTLNTFTGFPNANLLLLQFDSIQGYSEKPETGKQDRYNL